VKNKTIPWTEIHQTYVTTELTISALGRKFGVRRQDISAKANTQGWKSERDVFQSSISQESHARIREAAIADRVRLYDATREIADKIVSQMLKVANDPYALNRHVVQMEKTEIINGVRTTTKWAESVTLKAVNSRVVAEMAKALKDLTFVARQLDGIIDAPDRAKLDLEREKLDLAKTRTGLDNDAEQESGIARIPARDMSLLDNALPDLDQLDIMISEKDAEA
jgi:hypothetical protein